MTKDSETLEPLMTDEEVSAVLNVPPPTLAAWRSTGRVALPYVRVGGAIRYSRADVANFIQANRHGGAK